jgi:hypothetical protein
MKELKTLKVKEKFINYKVFSYLWLANTLQRIKENALFVGKNFNQPIAEIQLVQKNVEKKENTNMIKSILNKIQRFQDKHLKIGNRIIERKLINEQERNGEKIENYRLEIKPITLLRNLEFQNTENVNYVGNNQTGKFIIQNTIRRILS